MFNINDPSLYKRCNKKQFEMWMCMPPYGTVVINRMEQYDALCKLRAVIPDLNKREFITPEELIRIKNSNIQIYNFIIANAYVINKNMNVVLCGTEGELWATSYSFVCNQYQMYHSGEYCDIPNVISTRAKMSNGQYLLHWCKIRTKKTYSDTQTMAMFVPVKIPFYLQTLNGTMLKGNLAGIQHGKGDFIVCESLNGRANLSNRWIVNGLVFADTYNNRGWEDNLTISRRYSETPKELFIDKDKIVFTDKFMEQLESLYANNDFCKVMQKSFDSNNVIIKVQYSLWRNRDFGAVLRLKDNICECRFLFANRSDNCVISNFWSIEQLFLKLKPIVISDRAYKEYYSTVLNKCKLYIERYAKNHNLNDFLALVMSFEELSEKTVKNICKVFNLFDRYIKNNTDHEFAVTDERCEDSSDYFSITLFDKTIGTGYNIEIFPDKTDSVNLFAFSSDEYSKYYDEPYDCNLSTYSAETLYTEFCEAVKEINSIEEEESDEYAELSASIQKNFDRKSYEFFRTLSYIKSNKAVDFVGKCISIVAVCVTVARKLQLKYKLMLNRYIGNPDTGVYTFSIIFNCEGCAIENLRQIIINIYSDNSNPDYFGKTKDSNVEHNIALDMQSLKPSTILDCVAKTLGLSDEELSNGMFNGQSCNKSKSCKDYTITFIMDRSSKKPKLIRFKYNNKSFFVGYSHITEQFLLGDDYVTINYGVHTLEDNFGVHVSTLDEDGLADKYDVIPESKYYDNIAPFFDAALDKCAYRLNSTHILPNIRFFDEVVAVNVDYEDKRTGYVYLSMNKWFSQEKAYFVLTSSSLKCLEYSFPDRVTRNMVGKIEGVKYDRIHYHNLLIRLGLFSHITEFKQLKLLYIQLNEEIFDGLAPHNLSIAVLGYAHNSTFDQEDAAAYYTSIDNRICVNAKYSALQHGVDKITICTLIHEMCHACAYEKYGSCTELDGEDGATLYGISKEKYGYQVYCHGKRFNEFVELATKRNKYGFNHDAIFSYGVGHPDFGISYSDWPRRDSYIATLAEKNVFNLGQSYRNVNSIKSSGDYCKRCGSFVCNCNNPDLITINQGEYLGVCISCGKLHIFNDSNVFNDKNVSLRYFDSIDRIGAVSLKKCECGGKLVPQFYDDEAGTKYMKAYAEDFKYCQRLKNHIMKYVHDNIAKYNRYFNSNMNCELQVVVGGMPVIEFNLIGDSFKEMYKFFIAHSLYNGTVGRLYRDYGLEAKGYLIHSFQINNNKSIERFIDYLISYIKKDSREITSF